MSRIILKISGEALKNDNEFVAKDSLDVILNTVTKLKNENHKIGIVIGGGNFFRGREHNDMNKVTGDTIGMLGTVMNALYIKDYLEKNNINVIVSTPFSFPELLENYSNEELKNKFDNDNVIIFGGGIGKSGYSTDSGVILASDIVDADLIVKMTNVNGVYDSDPKLNKNAIKYNEITYDEIIEKNLQVMDLFAIEKCKEKNIKILVINIDKYNNINECINNQNIGTLIGD